MGEAVTAVKEKRMTQRAASKIFKVSQCTLQNRFIGKTQMSQGRPTKLEMAKKQNGQPSHQTLAH